jgi:hypothetical protein
MRKLGASSYTLRRFSLSGSRDEQNGPCKAKTLTTSVRKPLLLGSPAPAESDLYPGTTCCVGRAIDGTCSCCVSGVNWCTITAAFDLVMYLTKMKIIGEAMSAVGYGK